MSKSRSFSFILSPVTIEQLKDSWPLIRLVPDFIMKSSAASIPPFKVSRLKGVRSGLGIEIDGYLIVCPLLRRRAGQLKEEVVLSKIISAGRIAERLRSGVLGLGGYGSILSAQAFDKITQSLKVPVTSGNALTAWSVVELIYRTARIRKFPLKESIAAIVNVNSCIGRLCAVKLSQFVKKVVEDGADELNKAGIVINADSSGERAIDVNSLRPGAILCEVSPAGDLSAQAKSRGDITVIEAGLVKAPYGEIISAAMAETMLLALEGRFVNYSAADSINPDKLEEIADLAARHGFEIYAPEASAM